MSHGVGNVGYKDALVEGKWNMGAFIFQQMNSDMIKMADCKDANDFLGWFKRFKTLHNKVKATLLYFDENNRKKVHIDRINDMDKLRADFIKVLTEYNFSIETNHDQQKRIKYQQIVSLVEKLEQELFICMPQIGAWLPTKKSFSSWEDELQMDYQ